MRPASLPRVLAFAVLPDNHPVQVSGLAIAQRGLRTREDPSGPDVSVLLEGLADGEAQAPERDMIGDIYQSTSQSVTHHHQILHL